MAIGYHNSDGYRIEPLDDRDSDDPEFRVDSEFSSPDFQFSDDDPAVSDPEPREEVAPAWNRVEA